MELKRILKTRILILCTYWLGSVCACPTIDWPEFSVLNLKNLCGFIHVYIVPIFITIYDGIQFKNDVIN